jgi:hypothetical protein
MQQFLKKPYTVIAVCLGCTIALVFFRTSGRTGIDSLASEQMWVMCNACNESYQMNNKEYYHYIENHLHPPAIDIPPLLCKKCGKDAVYKAEKCEKCGNVFFPDTANGDFPDKCPKCGYSKIQTLRMQ